MSRCPHNRILVIRTKDFSEEWASCEDCNEAVPEWKTRPHKVGKYSYRYRYVDKILCLPTVEITATTSEGNL